MAGPAEKSCSQQDSNRSESRIMTRTSVSRASIDRSAAEPHNSSHWVPEFVSAGDRQEVNPSRVGSD
jgi:hypothetical protein